MAAGLVLVAILMAALEMGLQLKESPALTTLVGLSGMLAGGILPIIVLLRMRRPQIRQIKQQSHSFHPNFDALYQEVTQDGDVPPLAAPTATVDPSELPPIPPDETRRWTASGRSEADNSAQRPAWSEEQNMHSKQSLRVPVLVGCAILVVLAVVIGLTYLREPSLDLEVRAYPDDTASIKNIGNTPIRILSISINDREDCKPSIVGQLGVLNVGDSVGMITKCGIVRMTVRTDQGDSEYSFR